MAHQAVFLDRDGTVNEEVGYVNHIDRVVLLPRAAQAIRLLNEHGFKTVVNLLLMGILLDSAFQWVILGASYPGAALVIGPVLIVLPYTIARALSNRLVSRKDLALRDEIRTKVVPQSNQLIVGVLNK
jgi:hypothetical protein